MSMLWKVFFCATDSESFISLQDNFVFFFWYLCILKTIMNIFFILIIEVLWTFRVKSLVETHLNLNQMGMCYKKLAAVHKLGL